MLPLVPSSFPEGTSSVFRCHRPDIKVFCVPEAGGQPPVQCPPRTGPLFPIPGVDRGRFRQSGGPDQGNCQLPSGDTMVAASFPWETSPYLELAAKEGGGCARLDTTFFCCVHRSSWHAGCRQLAATMRLPSLDLIFLPANFVLNWLGPVTDGRWKVTPCGRCQPLELWHKGTSAEAGRRLAVSVARTMWVAHRTELFGAGCEGHELGL